MSPCDHCAGTFLALTVFLVVISSPISAAPVYEDDVTTEQSQLAEYSGEGSTRCYYNFKHYEEGDRIITNEPCLNCTCNKRMLMCYLRVCPFTKAIGQDCKVEKRPDQCCPVITCPEVPVKLLTSSTTPEPTISSQAVGHPDNHGCTLGDSTFYPDGAQVPQDPNKPCELCYCIRNRTACVMQECTLNVEGCQPVYQDGVCCPVRYDCDYDEAPTTERASTGGLILSTTPSPLGCTYDSEIYNDGELIVTKTQKPCEHCYCMRGDIVCAVRSCGTPLKGKDCEPVPPPEGECCPITYKCANGTVPLDSMSLMTDTYGLKPEDSVLHKPEKHPEDEPLKTTQEAEGDKIHDALLNNQQPIKSPTTENDDTVKPDSVPDEKVPDLESNVTDKSELESPIAQDKVEVEGQSLGSEENVPPDSFQISPDSLHVHQISSDALETDVDESESDYLHHQTVQDEIEPSGDKVSNPKIETQETSSSIEGVTPIHDNDGIQQIHVGQIEDLVTEVPPKDNLNLATSAPKLQDDSESGETEQKPNDSSPTVESNPLSSGDSESASVQESSVTNKQETSQQVDLEKKPDIKNDDTRNKDEIKPQVSPVDSETTNDAEGTDKPDNDVNRPELDNKEKIETTGNIDSNEIIKISPQEEDQSKEKPNTGNEVESDKRPSDPAQVQPSDDNDVLQTVSQETDKKEQVSEVTELKPENEKTDISQESDSVEKDENKNQDSDTKETSSEEEHKSQESEDSNTKETISGEENKSQESEDSNSKETSIEEEHKSQESTESQTPVLRDPESVISDETVTISDSDEISTESDQKPDALQNIPTTQSVDSEQSVTEDHEIKSHDSKPEGTVQNENKPEDIHSVESVPSEDVPQDTELTKPEENTSQVSVTDELSNDVSKTKDSEHEHTQASISDGLSNDVSKPQHSDSEHTPVSSDIAEKAQETEKLTGDQSKPLNTHKPDEVQVQETGNVQTDETGKKPLVGFENEKGNENVSENVSAGEAEVRPSDENVIIPSLEVGNQKLEHSDTKPSSKFDVSETKPEDTVTEDNFVAQTTENSSDSDISPDKPIKDPSISVEKPTVPQVSDDKSVEDASTVLDEVKPTDSVSSESSGTENTEEKLTSTKVDDQSEVKPTAVSEDSKPSLVDEPVKPHDSVPIQDDVVEEQPESEEPNPTVEVSTDKIEAQKESFESEVSTKAPSINEKESSSSSESKPSEESSITIPSINEKESSSSSESKPTEESSIASDEIVNSQDTNENAQHLGQVEPSSSSNDESENKLPETIQSESQDAADENTSKNESNINPNEVTASNSEPNVNEDSTEKQSDINSISSETNLHGENQKENELLEKKPTLGESSSNTDSIDEKLDQPSENKPKESEIDKQQDNISETSTSESGKPIKTDEISKPNEDVTIASVSNTDKLDENKQLESPSSTNIPDQSHNIHSGTDDESNTDKFSPPILHDFIESSEFDEEEEQPLVSQTSSETDKPSKTGEDDSKEESKPHSQSDVSTDTKVETSPQLDQVTSNTKIDSENSPASEVESSEIDKPQDQKEILPENNKEQDIQTPTGTEIKHDNEDKPHKVESPTANEISNDHKIIFEAEPGHGGIIHDLKETANINFPGPAGILEQDGVPGEGSCLVEGKTYSNNSNVPSSNVCHRECKCISSVVHCFGIPCAPPPADMDNCMPVKQGDSCCPSYACDANVTPGSLEAQNQMGNEENVKDEQKLQPDDVVPTELVESGKPEKNSEVNNEEKIVPPLPVLPESSVSEQPTVTSDFDPVKEQGEVNPSGENIKNESPNTQVHNDGLPVEEEGTIDEISETIDDSKLQTSDSILPSDDQSADRDHSTDLPLISLEQKPLTLPGNADSPQTQDVPSSDLEKISENINSSPTPVETPTVETSINNEQNIVPLPTSEISSDNKHTSTEQDETINSLEGSPESAPSGTSNKDTVQKDSEPSTPQPDLEKGDDTITPTQVPVEKPADTQNIVDKPTISENENSNSGLETPVETPTDEESQNFKDKVDNLSVVQEQVKPQETPISQSTENDNPQEPSGITGTFGDEQPTTESVSEEEQPIKEKDKLSETLSQNKFESSDPLNKPISPQSTSNEGDIMSEQTTASGNDQTLVHEIPALPNISDDTLVQVDNTEPENSDLEHIAPVFEIIEPNLQEEVADEKPTVSSEKDSEESLDKLPTTVVSQGEVSVTTPSSDSNEQNTNHGYTESVSENPSDDTKNDEEPSDKHPSSVSETPEDTVTVIPLSDNNEPNVVHETNEDLNESDDKKPEDSNDFKKPSSAISDFAEDIPTISPSTSSNLPIEPVQVVEDLAHETPSEVTGSVQKPTEDNPLVSKLPDASATVISPSDNKEPSNDESATDSLINVQESSDPEPSKPEKGSDSTLGSEVITEIPNKEEENAVQSKPSSLNTDEISPTDNAEKPISSDGVVTDIKPETLETDAPDLSSSNDDGGSNQGEKGSDNPEISEANIPDEGSDDSQLTVSVDNELPVVPHIDPAIIMDHKTETPDISGVSSSESPLSPAEDLTPDVSNENDKAETSNPLDSPHIGISANDETKQQTHVEHDVNQPTESVELPAVQSGELPDKSDLSETKTDQKVETSSTSLPVEENQSNKESDQPVKDTDSNQLGNENEKEQSEIIQESTPVISDSASDETKPTEVEGTPVSVVLPSADEINVDSEQSSEPSPTDNTSPVSTEEGQPESENLVTKSPEIIKEKDETNIKNELVSTVDSTSKPVSPVVSTNSNDPSIQGSEVSFDSEADKVFTPVKTDSSLTTEPKPQSPSEPSEDTTSEKTETNPDVGVPAIQESKPTKSEIDSSDKDVPSEAEALNVDTSKGESNEVSNTVKETNTSESVATEKPDVLVSIVSKPATSPSTSSEADQTPLQTPTEKDSSKTPVDVKIPESVPNVQENSSESLPIEENVVTESAQLIPTSLQPESDVKPVLHQTVIAETSSVHASTSSAKIPETEEQKPDSLTDEGVHDDDKIVFPEVTDDSIQTSAPPSLITQEALNELASGQHTSPQKPLMPQLPSYFPNSDSGFGPLPMPGWTPKPYLPETSSEESITDEDEEHSPEGDMDYGGNEEGAFGPGTCRYGGKVYVSAQQIPRDDPCDFCFCFRSDIICLQQSCPPPIHRCRQESIKGFCCPRYECPVSMATTVNLTTTTTTTTTTLPPHFFAHAYKGAAKRTGCVVRGLSYRVGDEIKSASGPCLQCICGADGQMQCDPKICSPEPMLRKMMEAAVSRRRR